MKNIKLLFILSLFGLPCLGQEKEKAIAELNKVSDRYKKVQYMSFDIQYTYSDADKPGEGLDSLKANFKLNGTKYWYEVANTRTVSDGENTVVVYNDDSIIYLSRSTVNMLSSGITALSDSLPAHNDIVYSVSDQKKITVVTLDFNNNSRFKRIQYEINKKTGLLNKVVQVVNTKYMYDPEFHAGINDTGKYSVVEAAFDNYNEQAIASDIFNTYNYIQKNGKDYTARAPYQSYKVFLGNPDL